MKSEFTWAGTMSTNERIVWSIKEGYVMPFKPEQPTEMLLPGNLK